MNKNIFNRAGYRLSSFCEPLTDRFGVNHFYHYMLTDSGHFASIGSNSDWHDRLYSGSEGYGYRVLPYLRQTKNLHGGLIFTQATPDDNWQKMADIASEGFNVHFGLQIMVQTSEGIEGFGFALNTKDPYRHMAFLNALPEVRLFIHEYRNAFQPSILKNHLTDVATLIGPAFYEVPTAEKQLLKRIQLEMPNPFTRREVEVIRELLKGGSAAVIAEKLFLSKRTVEHHLERIKDKFDCSSKADLFQKIRNLESIGYFSWG